MNGDPLQMASIGRDDRGPDSLAGGVAFVGVLAFALIAASYPLLALGVVIGASGTLLFGRAYGALRSWAERRSAGRGAHSTGGQTTSDADRHSRGRAAPRP